MSLVVARDAHACIRRRVDCADRAFPLLRAFCSPCQTTSLTSDACCGNNCLGCAGAIGCIETAVCRLTVGVLVAVRKMCLRVDPPDARVSRSVNRYPAPPRSLAAWEEVARFADAQHDSAHLQEPRTGHSRPKRLQDQETQCEACPSPHKG